MRIGSARPRARTHTHTHPTTPHKPSSAALSLGSRPPTASRSVPSVASMVMGTRIQGSTGGGLLAVGRGAAAPAVPAVKDDGPIAGWGRHCCCCCCCKACCRGPWSCGGAEGSSDSSAAVAVVWGSAAAPELTPPSSPCAAPSSSPRSLSALTSLFRRLFCFFPACCSLPLACPWVSASSPTWSKSPPPRLIKSDEMSIYSAEAKKPRNFELSLSLFLFVIESRMHAIR
jgi:hypothetical protein